MAHVGKRIGLAVAQINANSMGLKQTGDRLKILRRQLRRHKDMTDPERKENIKWALAKLRDTKDALEVEADRHLTTEDGWTQQTISSTLNKGAKFMGVVVSLTGMVGYIRDILVESCSKLHIGAVIVATAGLVAVTWHIVDRFFSNVLEDSVYNVMTAIDRCYRSLSDDLADFKPVKEEKKD